ncbi:single-stranded DNA-binding protein [Glutamicibacter sp. FR1]|uniref:single-stranded DNA-binding protein n=1 Tax=Glutamicibacter sp. FR1 TaxID=3393744 RepID=UPI0039AECFFF
MSDLVTIRGIVGTEPQLSITPKGVSILKFRVATHERKRDLETGQWADGPTNWYAVSAFRGLGENSMESLAQGDHVMIFGKLQIRDFERADGTRGISADIEAYSIGHDLRFGTSSFSRVRADTGEIDRVQHPSRSADTEGSWQNDDGEAA